MNWTDNYQRKNDKWTIKNEKNPQQNCPSSKCRLTQHWESTSLHPKWLTSIQQRPPTVSKDVGKIGHFSSFGGNV
jgi:hypothetical protein